MAVPRLLQGLKVALQQSAGGRHRVKMARCRLKGRSCYVLSWLRDGQEDHPGVIKDIAWSSKDRYKFSAYAYACVQTQT